MNENEKDILNNIEPNPDYFSSLDFAIANNDSTLLDHLLSLHREKIFMDLIGNSLLHNVLVKGKPEIIRHVLRKYRSSFCYINEGHESRFTLCEEENYTNADSD